MNNCLITNFAMSDRLEYILIYWPSMADSIVVIGTGYAGTKAVQQLEQNTSDVNITWIGENQYHLVLHESHRIIRDPTIRQKITIPVKNIKSTDTNFIKAEVTNIDTEARSVELSNGSTIPYDYVLVAIGSQTAHYGIPGLNDYSITLKSLEDALTIHKRIFTETNLESSEKPTQVLIGGAGLSGIQVAGEVAKLRDEAGISIEITLLEALDEILPGHSSDLQKSVRKQLIKADIDIRTGNPLSKAGDEYIHLKNDKKLSYDILIWTGGITGHDIMESIDVEKEHNRIKTDTTFKTSDDRIFTVGDAALVENGENPVPPTAQAAWQAADVAANNIERSLQNKPLRHWTYEDKGTLISIGDKAIAHNVSNIPFSTFGSYPAQFLKKFVAARWIAGLTSWYHASSAWSVL